MPSRCAAAATETRVLVDGFFEEAAESVLPASVLSQPLGDSFIPAATSSSHSTCPASRSETRRTCRAGRALVDVVTGHPSSFSQQLVARTRCTTGSRTSASVAAWDLLELVAGVVDRVLRVDQAREIDRRAGDHGVTVDAVDRVLEFVELHVRVAHRGQDVAEVGVVAVHLRDRALRVWPGVDLHADPGALRGHRPGAERHPAVAGQVTSSITSTAAPARDGPSSSVTGDAARTTVSAGDCRHVGEHPPDRVGVGTVDLVDHDDVRQRGGSSRPG